MNAIILALLFIFVFALFLCGCQLWQSYRRARALDALERRWHALRNSDFDKDPTPRRDHEC